MEEEKKEVVEAEVKEEQVEEAPAQEVNAEQNEKNALVAFILAVVGFVLASTALGLLICGIISKSFVKKVNGPVEKKPHAVFYKVAKVAAPIEIIVGIVLLCLGALALIIWLIYFIVVVVIIGGAAAADAASIAMLLF